ncbi:hypothetical protein HYX05_02570 [Candidatus Woesearchaeota archaeon]|nr:hypothetical protein [Candidatus Woesearchaeota archaeon]
MRLLAFILLFMILAASASLAAGLQITEIDVNVDYDEAYTYRVENRDRIDSNSVPVANGTRINVDVLPGSNLTLTLRVENTFQGEDPELRGVFATIVIEEIDDGADLEQDSIDFDLEPGNDERVDVKFQIPIDADAGLYNTLIEVEGEDRNGTSYITELNMDLEVKKQSHDIRITRVLLTPGTIDCDRKAKLTAEIANAGSNFENEVALEFKSGNLGINSFDKDISLESSDEASAEEKTYTKTLNIEVPSFLRSGAYPIFINLYWKNFVLFDQKTADLVVRDCISGTAPKPEITDREEIELIQPEDETQESLGEQVTATEEISILSGPAFVPIALGAAVIIVLAAVIVFGYLKTIKAR